MSLQVAQTSIRIIYPGASFFPGMETWGVAPLREWRRARRPEGASRVSSDAGSAASMASGRPSRLFGCHQPCIRPERYGGCRAASPPRSAASRRQPERQPMMPRPSSVRRRLRTSIRSSAASKQSFDVSIFAGPVRRRGRARAHARSRPVREPNSNPKQKEARRCDS